MRRGIIATGTALLLSAAAYHRCDSQKQEAPHTQEVSGTEHFSSRNKSEEGHPSSLKTNEERPKKFDIKQVRSQVLNKVKSCKSELEDYWDVVAEKESDEMIQAARVVYEDCVSRMDPNHEDQGRETAWDVLESLQSYKDRCNGNTALCDQLAEEQSQAVAECTGVSPKMNIDFIWGLDEKGEILRTGAFPGWQLSYKEGEKDMILSLVVFPAPEDGTPVNYYTTVSKDGERTGYAAGFLKDSKDFCNVLKGFKFNE